MTNFSCLIDNFRCKIGEDVNQSFAKLTTTLSPSADLNTLRYQQPTTSCMAPILPQKRPRSPNQRRITNYPSRSRAGTQDRHGDEDENPRGIFRKPWISTRTVRRGERKVATPLSPDHESNAETNFSHAIQVDPSEQQLSFYPPNNPDQESQTSWLPNTSRPFPRGAHPTSPTPDRGGGKQQEARDPGTLGLTC